jgi:hypothetical protein
VTQSADYKVDGRLPAGDTVLHDLDYRDYAIVIARVQCARTANDVDKPQPKTLRIRELVMLDDEQAEEIAELLDRELDASRGQMRLDDAAPTREQLLDDIHDLAAALDLTAEDEAGHVAAVGGPADTEIADAAAALSDLQLRELRARLTEVDESQARDDGAPVDEIPTPDDDADGGDE